MIGWARAERGPTAAASSLGQLTWACPAWSVPEPGDAGAALGSIREIPLAHLAQMTDSFLLVTEGAARWVPGSGWLHGGSPLPDEAHPGCPAGARPVPPHRTGSSFVATIPEGDPDAHRSEAARA